MLTHSTNSVPNSDLSENKFIRPPMILRNTWRFTGEITFDTGVKVKADLLVTPNTDVPLILGTQVMEENKVSSDFLSKQLMMEKENNVVNLQFSYKSEVPRHAHFCEAEAESGLDQIETTQETQHGVTA